MFGFFKKSPKAFNLLDYDFRKYFENNMLWLMQEFPEPGIDKRKVFTPSPADFPIKWNNSEENARSILEIVAANMEIDINELELDFYDYGINELNAGTATFFLETDKETPKAAGIYHHINENGKYGISLDKANLGNPDALVATIAHELCHVKLLGHKKLEENDEHLTDMATVFFGFGIFNANTAFNFYQNGFGWGYQNAGYLKQEEWAYVLALFAFIRYEDDPAWKKYLNKTIRKDFERSLKYMLDNEKEIFHFKEQDD